MKRLIFALTLLALTVIPFAAQAQTQPTKCDLAAVLKQLSDFKSSGDNKQDLSALLKIQSAISNANIACNGVKVDASGDKVVGPFDLPKGLYRASLYSKDALSVSADVLDGDCNQQDGKSSVFTGFADRTSGVTVFMVRSEGCKLIVHPSLFSNKPWTLTIEPLQ
jgi:hypothetical protein